MTQNSYFALIKYVNDNVFSVIPTYRIVDSKKMLPMWIKCKSEDELDKFFNPVEAERGNDCSLEVAHLIKISKESSELREYSIKLKAKILNEAVDTSQKTRMELRKRKINNPDKEKKKLSENLDETIGPEEGNDGVISAQQSKRPHLKDVSKQQQPIRSMDESLETTKYNYDDADACYYTDSPDVSTPKKVYNKKALLNISVASITNEESHKEQAGIEILQSECLPEACEANFAKLYRLLEEYRRENKELKEILNALGSSKNMDTSAKSILIGGKFVIPKSSVAYGLAKSSLERFFRELISCGWKTSEKAGHNLTGVGTKNNVKINQEKLNCYIDYAINAWNDYHNKNNPGSCLIIPSHQLDNKRKGLRSLMGLICQEETRKANKMKD